MEKKIDLNHDDYSDKNEEDDVVYDELRVRFHWFKSVC